MKRAKYNLIILFTLLALPLWTAEVASDSQTELKAAELRKLRQQISDLTRELESLRSQYDVLQVKLRDSEKQIGSLRLSLRQIERQLDEGERRLAEIAQQKQQAQTSLNDNAQRLNHQIRVTYMTGKQPYIKMMLNLQDPSKVGRILKYYDYYNYARAHRIQGIRSDIRQLETLDRKQQQVVQQQTRLKVRKEKEKRSLEQERDKRRRLLAQLRSEIGSRDKELQALRENEQRLQKLLNNLDQTMSEIEAVPKNYRVFAQNKGQLPWPVKGKILYGFGSQRGQEMRWKGVVLQVEPGSRVRAIAHGRVAFADWLRGYGLLTIIDHGDGYMSLYGNNQSLYKSTGDWVVAGEVVAEAGRGGETEGDTFYFEIRHKGVPINPARWCR